jgi:hypothetical protein
MITTPVIATAVGDPAIKVETKTTAVSTASLTSVPTLADLATSINPDLKAIAEAKSTPHALHLGDMLNRAKVMVPHGNWKGWLKDNCKLSERTAQRYMDLATNRQKLEQKLREKDKSATVADLLAGCSLNTAMALLKDHNPQSGRSGNASDAYDTAEKTLLKKLVKLAAPEADAAATKTKEKQQKVVDAKLLAEAKAATKKAP